MSYGFEEVKVVDVIAHEADVLHGDSEFVAELLHRLAFGHVGQFDGFCRSRCETQARGFVEFASYALVEVVEQQFACTEANERRLLRRDDAAGNAGLAQEHHAHAVVDVESFEFIAFGGVVHAAVREAAVHVCEEKSYFFQFVNL